ncbi:MAG: Mrp/NBP35 family ATP-binding protein [Clostridia bacterium]|nr:Mrp/NBP35 family ATP-binding protein [Clostridia bacterium]
MGCTHDCKTCGQNCGGAEGLKAKPHEMSNVKKVIAVVSGKGGVGKSSVSAMLSVLMNRRGYKTAILDADITGPSIPRLFGLKESLTGDELGMYPARTKTGISVVSTNLLLPDETTPVIWRGAVIAGTVTQFWTDTVWGDVDFMFVDMPPGTGDVPLTVFQSLPVDGIVIVTSPQDLVSMIVAKAVNMANKMNVPILGLIENYSYLSCPDCGKHIELFGESHIEKVSEEYSLPVLAKIPLDPTFARQCDSGLVELFEGDSLDRAADLLEKI